VRTPFTLLAALVAGSVGLAAGIALALIGAATLWMP